MTKPLRLESKELDILEVDRRFNEMCGLINNMLEDSQNSEEIIPLHQYSTEILRLVIEYGVLAEFKNENFVQKPINDITNVFAT